MRWGTPHPVGDVGCLTRAVTTLMEDSPLKNGQIRDAKPTAA
jgi:hypothetical protein